MRILHVISSLDLRMGGPSIAMVGLALAQQKAGVQVRIVTTFRENEDQTVLRQLEDGGAEVVRIGPAHGPLSRAEGLWATVEDEAKRADIVHIHAVWEEIQHAAARLCQKHATPYLIRPCGMLDPWSLAQSKWKKRIYLMWRLRRDLNCAAALHFTTTIEGDLTRPLGFKAPGIVEPNGLNLDDYEALPARGGWRAKWAKVGDRPVVLFMSRLHPKKGLELLLPAFAAIAQNEAMLVIAGPDAEGHEEKMRELAASLGIAGRVLFTGMLSGREKIAALVDADLFVLPSHQENFGNVVIEAMAAGTPVVVSDQVNLWPEVLEAKAGGVVKLEAPLIQREMEKWLEDESGRREAGERGRAFALQRYDWDAIARRWHGRYQAMKAQ